MNAPLRDLGPLAWVMDELKRTLDDAVQSVAQFVSDNQTSRQTDLAEVDSTSLRMARQALHQSAGALDMVGLGAAATTLRSLEAGIQRLVQKPALATPEAAVTVRAGSHAVVDYLSRLMREQTVPALALFPTYSDWQQLAGVSRAHPSDLWAQDHADVDLPAGKVYQPGPAVRSHLDRLVLPVVKSLSPQAAIPLAQLSGGLARGATDRAVRRFWAVAAAYFEAVAAGGLPDVNHVKRAASSVLLQYSQLLQGDTQSLEGHTHDLLFLASRVRPDPVDSGQAHLRAVWRAQGWEVVESWDVDARRLGMYDPYALETLRQSVHAAQQSWSVWTDGHVSMAPALQVLLQELADGLSRLQPEAPALVQLGQAWLAVASRCDPSAPSPQGLGLEVSNGLLLLEAELANFDPWDADSPARQLALAKRLNDVLAGLPAPEPESWMTRRYQRASEQSTLVQVVAQWRAELEEVEQALDAVFRQKSLEPLLAERALEQRLDTMGGIATLLELPAARQTLEVIREEVQGLIGAQPAPTDDVLEMAAARLGPNISALGWLLETFGRQPRLARESFVFDQATRSLVALSTSEGAGQSTSPAVAPDHVPTTDALQPVVLADDHEDDGAELLAIFMDEAMAVFDSAWATLGVLRQRPASLADLSVLRRGFHTLKGSARMVGLSDVGEAAWAMEQLLNTWLADQNPVNQDLLVLSEQSLRYLKNWLLGLQAGQSEAEAGHSQRIRASADALRLGGPVMPLEPSTSEQITPQPVELPVLEEVVNVQEVVPDIPVLQEAVKVIGPLRVDLDLYNVFLNEADEWSRRLCQGLAEWKLAPADPLPGELSALAHSLAGGAATVGYQGLSRLARSIEHSLDRALAVSPAAAITPAQSDSWVQAADEARHLLHQFAAGFLREPAEGTIAALDVMVFEPALAASPPAVADLPVLNEPVALEDRLDLDLFAVFEDEAQELLPRLSSALRQWVARPDNGGARAEVLRNLHTLKGSARLAGALRLGEMVHGLESDVLALPEVPEASQIAPLLLNLDQVVARFDRLCRTCRNRESPPSAAGSDADGIRLQAPEGLSPPTLPEPPESMPGAQSTVRVRTDLLDQIMAQTGDVMIARTRLESDMRTLRQSFKDMSSNIERLRTQLRDLELQTEMQLQSRMALSRETDARFDPLEFDRYTRVQELTRLLAESVNDVATVQHHLQRSVEAAEGNLAAQARQTRELQRDLLRTRLVAFDALDERLHRVVRQAAEASGKQVVLSLEQGDVEVDRAVLERLTPVLEHLLRNAVVHGVETPERRSLAGKPVEGHVGLTLEPRGNDLVITVSDDGAGLDVQRIHQRAVAMHLHASGAPFTQDDAARAIFASGVSTADEVNEVAGRGIGLDVVRNEVLGLGGRIEYLRPDAGGTAFRLVVPLSTAVTQVVMLRVGDLVFGVPAHWVEAVRRAQAPELTTAYVGGQWREGGEPMPFHWAGALLALSPESTDPLAHEARNWPVLEFHTAGQRVAWHVDEVLGHQEVVVKPMSPQLSRLPGLAGVTVLASGAVALIYNPVALSALYGESARTWARQHRAQGHPSRASVAADADMAALAPLVLVVDDSITVRRVTQRLLKREGYRVALAADGLQALERIQEELPVVVFCDIEMPRMDGFELVQRLRGEPATADLPVVMITSRLADKHREHAQSLGVDHYLGKPYAEEELLALVQTYARLAPAAR